MDNIYRALPRGGEITGWLMDEALSRFKARLWPADFLHIYAFEIAKDSKLRHVMNFLAVKNTDAQ